MNYELAKKLKDAGFPYKENWMPEFRPVLSELIEACGEDFEALIKQAGGWAAITSREAYMIGRNSALGSTPEEAVANLWLALNKK